MDEEKNMTKYTQLVTLIIYSYKIYVVFTSERYKIRVKPNIRWSW